MTLMQMLLVLLFLVIFIILATTRLNLHPFLTLLFAALLMGFLGRLDAPAVLEELTGGFGATLKSIGIVIACGTIIGTFLERSGGAAALAGAVLQRVGENKSPLAMSLTGFIVSIPVFCDSGFVILAPLNRALSRKTGVSLAVLAVALATGLYATHVFVPPTPGPLAAAATLGADIGRVLILGLVVAIPTAAAGLLWALWCAKRFPIVPATPAAVHTQDAPPPVSRAFLPLLLPILLIALKSVADYPSAPLGEGPFRSAIRFAGHPVTALLIGVLLAFRLRTATAAESALDWAAEGLKNAGAIILITGAGGAFGNILRATGIGDTMGEVMVGWQMGIFLPFLIAAFLKSAQGSSTVAIITTAALVSPLLPALGLSGETGRVLVVLAIGAGAMTVSHLNDSYFWVVSQFSDMDTATALKTHTLATLIQGMTGMITIAVLSFFLVGN